MYHKYGALKSQQEYHLHTFSNGLRLVYQYQPSSVSHLACFIHAGSRDELKEQEGLAHFIEHTIFKGTRRRKSYQVINRLEVIGGELNAYTSKEETCIYASFPALNNLNRAFDLIADIVFNASFPEKEIEKEKEIVLDEINSYLDSPSEYIFDEFEQLFFNDHPLSSQILGTPETVASFNRQMILDFIGAHYKTDRMVVSYCGNASFLKIIKLIEKFFPLHDRPSFEDSMKNSSDVPFDYKPFNIQKDRNSFQTHCLIGMPAPAVFSDERIIMSLLNNMLGGPGLNSRLNMSLREKHACSYLVESSYATYKDQGLHTIYLGTDHKNLKKSLKLVRRELSKFADNVCSERQLLQAKKQMLGQIEVQHDSGSQKMLNAGKSLLLNGEICTTDELRDKILQISPYSLNQLAQKIYSDDRLSYLIYPGE